MAPLQPLPGWYQDPLPGAPAGRYRYWSGTRWTEHVAGQVEVEVPVPPPLPSRPRTRPWLVAIGLAVAVIIAVGGFFVTRSDSKTATSSSSPSAWDPQVAPIAAKVAALRGLSFDHPVPVRYLTDDEFRKRVGVSSSSLSAAARRRLVAGEATLRAFGLLDGQTDLAKSFDTANESGILAYYDPDAREVVVRGTGPLDIERKAVLAHELTHVLQDQHFGLRSIRADVARSKTASSAALTALIEGDAERIKGAWLAGLSKADRDAFDAAWKQVGASINGEEDAAGTAEIVRIEQGKPYVFGPEVLKVVTADGGNGAVDDALRRHNPTDAIFLDPTAALRDPDVVSVPVPSIEHGARQVGTPDGLGAFDLFTVLAARLDRQVALDAADTWAGDRYTTYRSANNDECVRTTIATRSTAGAKTLAGALDAWARTMPGARVTPDLARSRVTMTSCVNGSSTQTPDNDKLKAAMDLLEARNATLANLLSRKYPEAVAECVSQRYVRAPAVVAVLDQGDVELTQTEQDALHAVGNGILKTCTDLHGSS